MLGPSIGGKWWKNYGNFKTPLDFGPLFQNVQKSSGRKIAAPLVSDFIQTYVQLVSPEFPNSFNHNLVKS